MVSIHATLAGGDGAIHTTQQFRHYVSIHATLAGGDLRGFYGVFLPIKFLSTPPSRVATCIWRSGNSWRSVSIHATLAGGDLISSADPWPMLVSIHATLAGGDLLGTNLPDAARGVSIHATLAGGDGMRGW